MRKYHYKTAAYQAKRNARKNSNSKLVPDIRMTIVLLVALDIIANEKRQHENHRISHTI
jgi:hypothetical protein